MDKAFLRGLESVFYPLWLFCTRQARFPFNIDAKNEMDLAMLFVLSEDLSGYQRKVNPHDPKT
jgi:hypothetical protein